MLTGLESACLGAKGRNQEFEAYPLSSSSPKKVIHAPSQLQDQRERTSEEGGPVATLLGQTRQAAGAKEGPALPQLGSQANCVCSHLLRPPLPTRLSPQGDGCPPSTPLRCRQTWPQTRSHWHKIVLLALGDKVRSRGSHSPYSGYQCKTHSPTFNHKEVMP